jgi:DnaJ-class molecular chaperone
MKFIFNYIKKILIERPCSRCKGTGLSDCPVQEDLHICHSCGGQG